MKKRSIFRGLIGILAVVTFLFLVIGAPSVARAEKIYRMKIQSAYPRGDISMALLKHFADYAKKKSHGRLLISVFADPELVSGEQLFEATQKGTVDMLHAVPAMWAGIVPVGEVEFGLPYAYRIPGNKSITEASDMVRKFYYSSGFVKLLRKEYAKHGLYWLDMHSYGKVITLFKKRIKTCKDFKGLKIRVEGIKQKFFDMLGARGMFIPGADAYMGLKLGTIDGSQWDVSCITGLKWYEVAPYWLNGGQNDAVEGNILVNMKTWKSLPEDLKGVLSDAAEDYYKVLLQVYEKEMKKVDELVKKGKVVKSPIDNACEAKCKEAAYKLWDEVAKSNPVSAQAIQMIKKWRKTLK